MFIPLPLESAEHPNRSSLHGTISAKPTTLPKWKPKPKLKPLDNENRPKFDVSANPPNPIALWTH
ncbi:hypothetical protein FS749_007705 [Ceratobasidium sp. UAMH 11750]|nr:hypothetical protein FS749_007705 [Ceratobasidium sp. UAMH 11750]